MTGPYITQLRGFWGSDLGEGLNQLAQNSQHLIHPNRDFQQAFQARILQDPNLINKFADIYKKDPASVSKLGFSKKQLAAISGQPQSLGSVEEDNAKTALADPTTQSENAAYNLHSQTGPQREGQALDLTGKKQDIAKGEQQIQINKHNIDNFGIMDSILGLNAQEAHLKVDEAMKKVADNKMLEGALNKVGKNNLFDAVSGNVPDLNLTGEERDKLAGTELYKSQQKTRFDDEQLALMKSQETRNKAVADKQLRGPTPHDYAEQYMAESAKLRIAQLAKAKPLPSNIGIEDLFHKLMDPSYDRPDVAQYIDEANALAPIQRETDARKEYTARSKDLVAALNNFSKNNKMDETARNGLLNQLNALGTELFGGVIDAAKIPRYAKATEVIPGFLWDGKGPLYVRTDQGAAQDNATVNPEVERLLKFTDNNPDWEKQLDASGQPPEIIAAVKAEHKKRQGVKK